MQLTVLGASGSTSGPGEPASSYLVTVGERRVVLDLGPGAFGALWAVEDPCRIDAVVLSHLHPDHCMDLHALDVAARHSSTAPWPTIPVYAPDGAAELFADAKALDFRPITDLEDAAGDLLGCEVRTTLTAHPVETHALRIEQDAASLVYTADTGWSDAVAELARGADVLLAEASFPDQEGLPEGLHLSGRQAGRMAASARAGRLVITHVPPWGDVDAAVEQARREFTGPVTAAVRERSYRIGRLGS